jgi:hypothetical protein
VRRLPQKVIANIDHTPALRERPEEEYLKIEVVPDKFARGLSRARNTGIQRSLGDIIADCPRPRRRSAIPWAWSRRGIPGEALA